MLITAQEAQTIAIAANKMQYLSDRIREASKRGEFTLEVEVNSLDVSMSNLLREAGYKVVGGKRPVARGFGVCDNDDQDYHDIYIIRWN